MGDLLHDPRERGEPLSCLPLLLVKRDQEPLMPGDKLLFAGRAGVHERMRWTLQNRNALRYVQTGEERAAGLLWRSLFGRRARCAQNS
ncbi:MAG: hypothetical protein ACQETD_08740 [Pseudomonadota bacterium]